MTLNHSCKTLQTFLFTSFSLDIQFKTDMMKRVLDAVNCDIISHLQLMLPSGVSS